MPGRKDYVSVKQDGNRIHVQKRLVLNNLKQLYHEFKERLPSLKIGFSKFASLRPKQCILAGAAGTHSVCVCTIHQNVKLMFHTIKLPDLNTYHDCLGKIMCNPPSQFCCLGECPVCPDIHLFKEELLSSLEKAVVDEIIFKQWVSTDRSSLETFYLSAEDFVDLFCEKLEALRPHSFIAKQQADFFSTRKTSLKTGEVLVVADFSENYSFVLQDASQGFHWNNSQATLHPFVAYYMESNELRELSFVIISDCLHHDTIAVYTFQKSFINFLKTFLPTHLHPSKLIYFSDGAASQYKNRKNFSNLCFHQEDFGISAEWHFSATSHGKGACDGLGGTVKRLAARASLQRPYNNQIMTPRQLYEWASTTIHAVHFAYSTVEDYMREAEQLEQRFTSSRTIPGTRKYHSFIPASRNTVKVALYSSDDRYKEEKVTLVGSGLSPESITGFVTCKLEDKWWLACVIEVIQDNSNVQITLLHPHGPSRSFKYPVSEDIRTVHIQYR